MDVRSMAACTSWILSDSSTWSSKRSARSWGIFEANMSNEKRTLVGCFILGDYIYPVYMGTTMSHYKDTGTYQTSSAMESKSFFLWLKWKFLVVFLLGMSKNLTRTLPAERQVARAIRYSWLVRLVGLVGDFLEYGILESYDIPK